MVVFEVVSNDGTYFVLPSVKRTILLLYGHKGVHVQHFEDFIDILGHAWLFFCYHNDNPVCSAV